MFINYQANVIITIAIDDRSRRFFMYRWQRRQNLEMLKAMRICTNMLATDTITLAKSVRIVDQRAVADQPAVADQGTGEQASGEHGSYGIRGTTFKITFSEIE
jgi:hypothetical protein